MSNREIRFISDAVADLDGLLQYTFESWGADQQAIYGQKLLSAVELLAKFPGRGRARDEISPGLRSLKIEHHTVYFRYDDDLLLIIRIVHERQDPTQIDWTGARKP